jgi:uncharacterized iron-regulated membrane protein
MTRSFKPAMRSVHTWIGVLAGAFISVLGLSGSVIVFRPEIEQALLPPSGKVADAAHRVSLDEASRQVRLVRPNAKIKRVRLPEAAGDPYVFQVESQQKRTERIVCDASTGRVLGALDASWLDWLVDLHHNALSGKPGRKAVGVVGIALFTLSIAGVLIWWIGAPNWRSLITVRRQGSSLRFHFELHRATGLWAYGFLALISFSGIYLAYPDTFRNALQQMTGAPFKEPAPRAAKGKARAMAPLDDFVRAARAAMPDGAPIELRLDSGKGGVDVRLSRAGDLPPAANHVYLDPSSAKLLAVDRYADHPVGSRALASLTPIHYGQVGGTAVKIMWALGGLTPSVLFVTGLVAWWRPSKRKRREAVAEVLRPEDLALTGR